MIPVSVGTRHSSLYSPFGHAPTVSHSGRRMKTSGSRDQNVASVGFFLFLFVCFSFRCGFLIFKTDSKWTLLGRFLSGFGFHDGSRTCSFIRLSERKRQSAHRNREIRPSSERPLQGFATVPSRKRMRNQANAAAFGGARNFPRRTRGVQLKPCWVHVRALKPNEGKKRRLMTNVIHREGTVSCKCNFTNSSSFLGKKKKAQKKSLQI